MAFWRFKRSAASVRLLIEFGQERGLGTELLAGSGLSASDLDDPVVELHARQELRVIENLLQSCGRPGLGLEMGLRYNFASYGFWGLGLVSSATAADALALALRFIPLTFAFCQISSAVEGDACSVVFEAPEMAPGLRRFLVERDAAAAARLMAETFGPGFSLRRFTLEHARPDTGSLDAVQRAVGVALEFEAARNALTFDSRLLGMRLPQANPITVAMCERACEDLMERRRARLSTAEWVRQYLAVVPTHTAPRLQQAADAMRVSDRTLKRRLMDEGTSFSALLAEVRGRQAQELLADESLSVTDVALRMGFSDLSSFSQTFKRWFGCAPSTVKARKARPGPRSPGPNEG